MFALPRVVMPSVFQYCTYCDYQTLHSRKANKTYYSIILVLTLLLGVLQVISTFVLAGEAGFGPATYGFGDRCATNCATPLKAKILHLSPRRIIDVSACRNTTLGILKVSNLQKERKNSDE